MSNDNSLGERIKTHTVSLPCFSTSTALLVALRGRELILWTTDKVCWGSYKYMAVRPLFKAQLEGYVSVSMVYL